MLKLNINVRNLLLCCELRRVYLDVAQLMKVEKLLIIQCNTRKKLFTILIIITLL